MRYYEFITNNILSKCAFTKIYNNNIIYEICADTHYKDRLKVKYNFNIYDNSI